MSDQPTLNVLKDLQQKRGNVTLVRNNENRWCCGGSNQALSLVEEPFVIYLCSYECFVISEGWEQQCLNFMKLRPQVAMAGHLIASPKYATGRGYKELETFPSFRHQEYVETRLDDYFFHVQGGFYILRMDAARQVGFFNANIVHDHMDVEFSYVLEASGWQIADLPFVNSVHRTTRPNIEGYTPHQMIYHPLTLDQLATIEREKAEDKKKGRLCNICGWSGPTFQDMVAPRYTRYDSICPRCGCHERHRALLGYIDAQQPLKGKRILDIAPVPIFQSYFEQRGATYFSTDLYIPALVKSDLRCAPFADASFDIVICYHVLEHIQEDNLAIQEIVRLLRPQGVALVQVPQNPFRRRTIEFARPDDSNHGHVRDPGLDYGERLQLPAVSWAQRDCAEAFEHRQRLQYGVYKDTGITYQLTKHIPA